MVNGECFFSHKKNTNSFGFTEALRQSLVVSVPIPEYKDVKDLTSCFNMADSYNCTSEAAICTHY